MKERPCSFRISCRSSFSSMSFHLLHYSATGYPRVCSLFTDLRRLSERYIRLYYLEKLRGSICTGWVKRGLGDV